MKYLEWNNLLASYFFNETQSESLVNLFITKEDIINIGSENFNITRENVWNDFRDATHNDLSEYWQNNKLIIRASKWLYLRKANRDQFEYPPYILYLLLSIYPFAEYSDTINAMSYYSPVNSILKRDGLPEWEHLTPQYNWLPIWEDLEKWSILEKDCQLGYYEHISVDRHIYIDYPRSQSLLTPSFYNIFKKLLFDNNITPEKKIYPEKIKDIIFRNQSILNIRQNVLEILKDVNHPLYSSIIKRLQNFITAWDGTFEINDNNHEKNGQYGTIAKLRPCFSKSEVCKLKFYYRLYSKEIYPENLFFEYLEEEREKITFGVTSSYREWSNPLQISFTNRISAYDKINRWKINFLQPEILFFTEGNRYGIGDYVSIENPEPGRDYYLLVEKNFLETSGILNFYSTEDNGKLLIKDDDFENIPFGYSFCHLKNIQKDNSAYNILFQDPTNIMVQIGNELQLDGRRYLKYIIPEILIEGLGKDTKIFAKFVNNGQQFELKKKCDALWEFSTTNNGHLQSDAPFTIVSDAGISIGRGKYELNSSNGLYSSNCNLYCDNAGNEMAKHHEDDAAIANNTFVGDFAQLKNNDRCYGNLLNLFTPIETVFTFNRFTNWDYDPNTELLLNFISIKGKMTNKEFRSAFQVVYREFTNVVDENNISLLSNISLNYFQTLGYISRYGENKEKISVNRPQITPLPCNNINKAKFIILGGRTKVLITKILNFCNERRNTYNLEQEPDQNGWKYLTPSSLILSINSININDITEKVDLLCKQCGIIYQKDINYLLGILAFISDIETYKNDLAVDVNNQQPIYIEKYNIDEMKFKETNSSGNESSLYRFQLNPHKYVYKYCNQGVYYTVDKNYGIYLTLAANNKTVVKYNKKDRELLIPKNAPFPLLYSRILNLMNGGIPDTHYDENNRAYLKYLDIDGVIVDILLEKLKQKARF